MNLHIFSVLETLRTVSELSTNDSSQDYAKLMNVYEPSMHPKMFTILGHVDPNFMTKYIG